MCVADRVAVTDAVAAGWYEPEEAEATGFVSIAVAGDEPAIELALTAARTAMDHAEVPAASLSHLFHVDVYHSGPEGWLPHAYLQRRLGVGDAFSTGIRQGCNGMFGALLLADAVLRAAPAGKAVLLVAADNFDSPLLDRWQCNPGMVMADGAAALLLSRASGFAEVLSVASVTLAELERLHRGTTPLHPADVTVGRPLDFGTRFAEFASSGGFGPDSGLEFVQQFVGLVDQLLDEAGLKLDQIDRIAFNHASREVVEDRLGPLGVQLERTTWEYGSTVGHVGAADQVIAFDHLLDSGAVGPGSHLLLLGLGPGVNIAGAVIRVNAVPPWCRNRSGSADRSDRSLEASWNSVGRRSRARGTTRRSPPPGRGSSRRAVRRASRLRTGGHWAGTACSVRASSRSTAVAVTALSTPRSCSRRSAVAALTPAWCSPPRRTCSPARCRSPSSVRPRCGSGCCRTCARAGPSRQTR